MRSKIFIPILILSTLFSPSRAPTQEGNRVWLPLIVKGGATLPAILNITDGITTVSLTKPSGANGYHLSNWTPAISVYKGGGTWQNSPLSDGRRLVDKRFDNTIETFEIKLNGPTQDETIREGQELRRLLEKASSYWTADWQDEPVWLEVQASCETNKRYAIIYTGAVPQDDNFFAQPFLQPDGAVIDELTLVIERGHWTAHRPMEISTEMCIQTSGQEIGWKYVGWTINTALPSSDVNALIEATCGNIIAGEFGGTWRSANGVAWNWAATAAGRQTYCLFEASDGDIFLAGEDPFATIGVIYRSQDCAVSWVVRRINRGTDRGCHSMAEFGGYLYLCTGTGVSAGCGVGIVRSNDDLATDSVVYNDGRSAAAILAASDGYLYATTGYTAGGPRQGGVIIRSADGVNWSVVFFSPYFSYPLVLAEPGDGYLYAPGWMASPLPAAERYIAVLRSADGINWAEISQISIGDIGATDFILKDGYYYLSLDNGQIYRSPDAISWELVADIGGSEVVPLLEYSGNGWIYAGESGDIWWESDEDTDVGRSATCNDEAFVINKQNVAQLTDIWVFDASGPTYTARFPSGAFPFDLLPNPLGNGDMVYFGIDPNVPNSGPFNNLIFDIGRAGQGDYTIAWQYSNGAAGWPVLGAYDGTLFFSKTDVNSIHWVPPSAWAAEVVNGVTALWIRAVVTVGSGAPIGPTQQDRDVYTVNWPDVNVDGLQVPGDISAIMRLNLRNRSDRDGPGSDAPDAWNARGIVGLRSVDRGDAFVSYINLADEQNPAGVTVTAGTGSTVFANDVEAPSGRRMTHTTDGASLWRDQAVVTLGPTIARDFYGTYHVFLRAQQYDRSGALVMGEIKVRLQVRTGSGGVTYTTDPKPFPNLNDWQLIDFGQVAVPASGVLSSDDLGDQSQLVVQVWSSVNALHVYLYDLVLIPVDEWAGDFVDKTLNLESSVENGCLLDVDSLAYPKRDIRATNRNVGSDYVRSVYQPIVNGPAILQANADQKLHFLTARGIVTGAHTGGGGAAVLTDANASFVTSGVLAGMIVYNTTDGSSATITAVTATTIAGTLSAGTWDPGDMYYILCPNWVSEPWVAHSVQVWTNARYLSARGDR